MTVHRRAFLAWVAGAAWGCRDRDVHAGGERSATAGGADPPKARAETATPHPTASSVSPGDAAASVREEELVFDASPVGPERAVVLSPAWSAPTERLPVLVALHGRGESVRGARAGAWGWVRDYQIERTMARLRAPPLTPDDFFGFVHPDRLAAINRSLVERPFRGLVVACPWVPDLLSPALRTNLDAARPFANFVVEQLLPKVAEIAPASTDAASTGIDGVSLGGRTALLVGLEHPERFGAVGSLQAAVQDSEASALTERAARARAASPNGHLRLLTSDADYFRGPITALHDALTRAQIAHEYLVVTGPHDYPFNRGPGGIEMLLWHDRVLRGEAP